jgi:hypothetical protein
MSLAGIDAARFAPVAGAQPLPAAKALARSFESALAKASTTAANAETGTADTSAPKGERTKAVAGHGYADIVAGPRKHLFLNTSGNARDGRAFRIVERDGREYHVYGEGKDRLVVALRKPNEVETKTEKTSATSGSFVANG